MTRMKAITDTWRMIDKYDIEGWKQVDENTVEVPDSEFERLFEMSVNKPYIINLKK